MMKAEEIKTLETFTKSLPVDSYIRPWLEEVMLEVIADIGNDFPVSPTIKWTKEECAKMIEGAKVEASRLLQVARTEVEKIRMNGERHKGYVMESLRQAERELCK